MTDTRTHAQAAAKGLVAIVGFLVLVEFASGILQGYYTPIYPQIADHLSISEGDINWFEAAQLIVSALCIPLLARLGDLSGHRLVAAHELFYRLKFPDLCSPARDGRPGNEARDI